MKKTLAFVSSAALALTMLACSEASDKFTSSCEKTLIDIPIPFKNNVSLKQCAEGVAMTEAICDSYGDEFKDKKCPNTERLECEGKVYTTYYYGDIEGVECEDLERFDVL